MKKKTNYKEKYLRLMKYLIEADLIKNRTEKEAYLACMLNGNVNELKDLKYKKKVVKLPNNIEYMPFVIQCEGTKKDVGIIVIPKKEKRR